MGSIQTGIQLQDNFTNVILGIINSVNLAVTAMDDMNASMSTGMDTASVQAARDEINQAAAAAARLNTELDGLSARPAPAVPAAPAWDTQASMQTFHDAGVSRLTNEMDALNRASEEVLGAQQMIDRQALETEILPQNASWEIHATSQRVAELARQMEELQHLDTGAMGNMGAERMNAQYERMRESMTGILNQQVQLNQAVEAGDISGMNEGYHRLNDLIRQAEVRARAVRQDIEALSDVRWQSDGVTVYTNAGTGRFQQEIQSANAMMRQLSDTQSRIASQALNTNILPQGAAQDLSTLATRVDMVRSRIRQIENNPVNIGTDAANAELERLRGMLHQALAAQEALNHAMQGMDAGSINASYLQLSQTVGNTERYLRDNVDEQGRFNRTVQELHGPIATAETGFKGWQKAIIVANQGISLIRGTLGRLGVTDMSGAFNRIDTMNRFQKTITTMTGDANQANAALAQLKNTTLGTAYGLDVASKSTQGFLTRGMSLGTAANQVRIWMDAVSFYGKGTNEQLENVVDAVGKIYSKGTVEAAQLDRLFDAGIGAAEMYAQAVGRSVSEVKDDLTNRKISSAEFLETVTQAMDAGVSAGAAKNAGDSWAVTFANMRAAVTRGWVSVIESLDAALASQGLPGSMEMVTVFGQKMESALNTVGDAMWLVVSVAVHMGELLGDAGSFLADHWSVIGPVVYGVAAALAVYYGWQMAANGIGIASRGVHTAMAAAQMMHAAVTGKLTAATAADIAAQNGLNASMYASPIAWIIMLVIALIAVFYAAVAAVNKFAGTSISATGVICGVFAIAAAVVANIFIGLANAVIGIGIEIYNLIAAFANFFANVFHDPVGAIMRLFADLFDFIAGIVQSAANIIDMVLGSNLAGAVAGFREDFAGAVDDLIGDQTIVMEKKDAQDYQLDRIAYGDAWDAGYSFGEGVEDKISSFDPASLVKVPDSLPEQDYSGLLGDANGLAGQTVDNTEDAAKNAKRAADSVAITHEDLKYLHDIAEREMINRFTTAEITVHQTNNNAINNSMDLDGVTEHLRVTMEEQMAAAAEGAH